VTIAEDGADALWVERKTGKTFALLLPNAGRKPPPACVAAGRPYNWGSIYAQAVSGDLLPKSSVQHGPLTVVTTF